MKVVIRFGHRIFSKSVSRESHEKREATHESFCLPSLATDETLGSLDILVFVFAGDIRSF